MGGALELLSDSVWKKGDLGKSVGQLTPPADQCIDELGITELSADDGFHGTSSGGTSWLAPMQAFVSVNAQMQMFIQVNAQSVIKMHVKRD